MFNEPLSVWILETREVYVLVFYCSSLEDVAFRTKSADFLWMLICGATMILFLTYFCGNAFFVTARAGWGASVKIQSKMQTCQFR